MNVPKNVLWFEVMLYLSLALDALSAAFQDRTATADLTDAMILIANLIAAGLILTLVYLVWLAARQRKNWPRWVLIGSLLISIASLAQIIDDSGFQAGILVDMVSCGLTVAGLYLSFTGDAKGWFNA